MLFPLPQPERCSSFCANEHDFSGLLAQTQLLWKSLQKAVERGAQSIAPRDFPAGHAEQCSALRSTMELLQKLEPPNFSSPRVDPEVSQNGND